MNDNEKKVDEQTVEQPEATSAETSDKAVENTQSEVAAADAGQTAGEKKKSFLDFFKKKKKSDEATADETDAVSDGDSASDKSSASDNNKDAAVNSANEGESVTAENGESSEDGSDKKKKKKRKKWKELTKEEKKKKGIRAIIITSSVVGAFLLFICICAIISAVGTKANFEKAASVEYVGSDFTMVEEFDPMNAAQNTVGYDEELGCYTFVTDDDFVVLQLTDIHIGAGAFSTKKDANAISAVATLVQTVKPDLVIATGDIAYPVVFQAGTSNNMRSAEMFAKLMNSLGVYWTITFGNHDTEAYSLYDREDIAREVYSNPIYKRCLFSTGPSNVDGYSNHYINVQNTQGKITQTFYMIDSHSYTDGDIFGLAWKYDKIHDNQVAWYETKVELMNQTNVDRGVAVTGDVVKSLCFFHIPLTEYSDAWNEFIKNDHKNTENVTYYYGVAGESGEKCYPGKEGGKLFDAVLEHGSTQGIFCGHDHYNTFSIEYKGIRLTYGMSIDYLAYIGIMKDTAQRGGTQITVSSDGSFDVTPVPYFSIKDDGSYDNDYMYKYWKQA